MPYIIGTKAAMPNYRRANVQGKDASGINHSCLVRRTHTDQLAGNFDGDNVNVQGEQQKKLDIVANNLLKTTSSGQVGGEGVGRGFHPNLSTGGGKANKA